MTPEEYWAYKAFTRDDVTERALASSEVFMEYRKAELTREDHIRRVNAESQEKDKQETLKAFDEFERKVVSSSELKDKFRKIKAHLDENPDIAAKTDPNFIAGINMLDLEG